MKIKNQSSSAITVSEAWGPPTTLAANRELETKSKKVILQIHYVPCQIEIEERGKGGELDDKWTKGK